MSENLLERLCNSRRRWLIVTGVTFVIALASILPQVDLLLAERSERAELQAQLAHARQMADELPLYEQRVEQKTAELDELRLLEVDESEIADLRSWLVDAAREAGCQVRRIDLSSPSERAWTDDASLLEPAQQPKNKKNDSPFRLATRTITFSVTGSTTEVRSLLKTLDEDRRLKHANSVALKPLKRNSNELQLDLSLWYFALAHKAGVT